MLGTLPSRGRKRSKSTPTPTPAETVEVSTPKTKPKKGKTPLEQTVGGYTAPAPSEGGDPTPDPNLEIFAVPIDRARTWCRRRFARNLYGQLVELTSLSAFGVAEQAARHVAMWAEALYAATDQEFRVHRCPPKGPKCSLCRTEAYDDPDFGGPTIEELRETASRAEVSVAYAEAHDQPLAWRARLEEMTGNVYGDEISDDEAWQLLNQVCYHVDAYLDRIHARV